MTILGGVTNAEAVECLHDSSGREELRIIEVTCNFVMCSIAICQEDYELSWRRGSLNNPKSLVECLVEICSPTSMVSPLARRQELCSYRGLPYFYFGHSAEEYDRVSVPSVLWFRSQKVQLFLDGPHHQVVIICTHASASVTNECMMDCVFTACQFDQLLIELTQSRRLFINQLTEFELKIAGSFVCPKRGAPIRKTGSFLLLPWWPWLHRLVWTVKLSLFFEPGLLALELLFYFSF